jgi:alkylation response protein AidB-like acyl-CoA dehydrogenase
LTLTHLTKHQSDRLGGFRAFADEHLAPLADGFDAEQTLSPEVVALLAERGYLGATVPEALGGAGMPMVEYGLLSEQLGRACQTVRNFVACQDMVALLRGAPPGQGQRDRWLGRIVSGEVTAAFALTEPDVGSDAKAVATTATRDGEEIVLRGDKKWISFAQTADLFLVFASLEGQHTAFLVERNTPGLSVEPVRGLMGLRGSLLGRITLDDCRIPSARLLGRAGTGLAFVASNALDLGRYSTAWGAVGLAQACLEESARYAGRRVQYGTEIANHQLVQQMLADMATDTMAARLLCHHAGVSVEQGDPDAVHHTLMAKYRSSTVAVRAADHAVQIHGAQGIGAEAPVQRYYRDAKVLEIIEGTSQIQQTLLSGYAMKAARS